MDALSDDSSTPRFFDFKKHPYDAVDPRLTYQFWPAFQSELKRKGLSNVLDLKFNPLPEEPTVASRRIRHDEALAKTGADSKGPPRHGRAAILSIACCTTSDFSSGGAPFALGAAIV